MCMPMCPGGAGSACNPCGKAGTALCGPGKEGCCSFCNNCFGILPSGCECCPCGSTGCLGFKNPLCSCCGNCNLMCYGCWCSPCFLADVAIADGSESDKAERWSSVMCTILTLEVISQVLFNLGSISTDLAFLSNIGYIFYYASMIYFSVIFGKAATKIASKQSLKYEPAECCEACCSAEAMCCPGCNPCGCSSLSCCCTYWCCFGCHFMQVARSMEPLTELTTNIENGRPEDCRCCNCWKLEGGTATAPAQ